jgi:hypothetical protein
MTQNRARRSTPLKLAELLITANRRQQVQRQLDTPRCAAGLLWTGHSVRRRSKTHGPLQAATALPIPIASGRHPMFWNVKLRPADGEQHPPTNRTSPEHAGNAEETTSDLMANCSPAIRGARHPISGRAFPRPVGARSAARSPGTRSGECSPAGRYRSRAS